MEDYYPEEEIVDSSVVTTLPGSSEISLLALPEAMENLSVGSAACRESEEVVLKQQIVARGVPSDQSEQAFQTTNAHLVESPSDEEEGDAVVAQVDSLLSDLEVLFQEQLSSLAEDVQDEVRRSKGKAVMTEDKVESAVIPGQFAIMALEERRTSNARPEEFISY